MRNFLIPIFIFLVLSDVVYAFSDWKAERRGNLTASVSSYTHDTVPDYGQSTRAELEQVSTLSDSLSLKNQLRWTSNSLMSDLNSKSNLSKKDTYEVFLGDNYIKYKNGNFITQLGFQDVVWGEAYGFNYADIVNPKDQRLTLYTDAQDARLPLFLLNAKQLFSTETVSGSMQILYSPQPRFSKPLPLDLFVGDNFSQSRFNIIKERTPRFLKESEVGGKLALSFSGIDASVFYFSYIDRDPGYSLEAVTASELTLKETHNRINSTGASFSKTIIDFVLRADFVSTKNKSLNYLSANSLKSYNTSLSNLLVSIDTPAYDNYSAVFIFAQSSLEDHMPLSFRKKNERYSIVKLAKTFSEDTTLELAYTHEYEGIGQALQSVLSVPINNNTDLKLGGQAYFGGSESNLKKYKNISSIFFSIRNYFQI